MNSSPYPVPKVSFGGWIKRISQALWIENFANKTKFFTFVFVLFLIFFAASLIVFSTSVVIAQGNQILSEKNQEQNTKKLQSINHTVEQPHLQQPFVLNPLISSVLNQLFPEKEQSQTLLFDDTFNKEENQYLTYSEQVARRNEITKKLLQAYPKKLTIYTNDKTAWPQDLLVQVETLFGPVTEYSETQFIQHNIQNEVWIGVKRNDKGTYDWWTWEHTWFFNSPKPKTSILLSYIDWFGTSKQQYELQQAIKLNNYDNLIEWDMVKQLKQSPIVDIQALMLFFVFLLFGIPMFFATAQASSWDQSRSKNVQEPYIMMKIPVWAVLVKESLSSFWPLVLGAALSALICGLLIGVDTRYVVALFGVVATGVGVVWFLLQLNMFLMVVFERPFGRTLARMFMMPMLFLPYYFFRWFVVSELYNVVLGKTLQEFPLYTFWIGFPIAFFAGTFFLMAASWRVGKYRKGFSPA